MGLPQLQEGELGALLETVRAAAAARTPLSIRAGGSKDFYGRQVDAPVLDVRSYRGVVEYEPTELVVVARCGTPLAELEALLASEGQQLAFEPPHFAPSATVGGAVAAGLSGPSRAAAGSLRDFVLGVEAINGKGELLRFGGKVMKNVAGYDLARVYAGSLGTLGVMTEVALKVLPRAPAQVTLEFEFGQAEALQRLNAWAGQPLPINASAWESQGSRGRLRIRLAGAQAAVAAAQIKLGGALVDAAEALAYWSGLREQTHEFFAGAARLWRLSLPPTTPELDLDGPQLLEWGGAQRWLISAAPAEEVFAAACGVGGHATLFRGATHGEAVFSAPDPTARAIMRRLKSEFDPLGIFNPGRWWADL